MKTARRNPVPRKRRARIPRQSQRIEDRRHRRIISRLLRRRRHIPSQRPASPHPLIYIIEEEKRPVALDRTTHRSPKLIKRQRRHAHIEIPHRIQILIAVVFMVLSGFLLWLAQRQIPIGTAYAVWTGIGAAGTFLVGIFFYGDPASMTRYLGLSFIVLGVITLKLAH